MIYVWLFVKNVFSSSGLKSFLTWADLFIGKPLSFFISVLALAGSSARCLILSE